MLKRIIKAVTVAVVIACLVICMLPTYAFADPVSATIMANAFAQAIAAYGASNGVAMTFDVTNSDGIGENVHELWKNFREGTQGVDDYATLAAAIFPELYYKAAVAVGAASDVYTVGVHIDDTYAEEFDNFYNWLLSGPAEMVQVDNQYYEFSAAQVGPSAVPINVLSASPWPAQPFSRNTPGMTWEACFNISTPFFEVNYRDDDYIYRICTRGDSSGVIFAFTYGNYYVIVSPDSNAQANISWHVNSTYSGTPQGVSWLDSSTNLYYTDANFSGSDYVWHVPSFPSLRAGLDALSSYIGNPVTEDIGVKSYDNAGIADFPDTADPNYDALNRAKDIPLNIPWDDALYGDGTGALSDAQTSAIASDVDLSLVEEGVIELVAENDTPAPNPGEVFVPFLPVILPNFNFNFSGIWHYVRDWVTSLGAWFGVMFTVWNTLPYAMIVPVYATAVVVIVLGVYKRFFM